MMTERVGPRRGFLGSAAGGAASLAVASLLADERRAAGSPAAKAKRVIWLFMVGGTSHLESFDPKPALAKHAGKTIAETPHKAVLDSPYLKKNLREFVAGRHMVQPTIYAPQVGFRKRGKAGMETSDWFAEVGECSEHLAVVRSMWTTDNDHGAQLQFHTGRHALEGQFPTIGSWIHYGLGSLNEDLPRFVVLGTPLADCCGGAGGHGANYLGPEHAGVRLEVDPDRPLPFASPAGGMGAEEQRRQFALLRELHGQAQAAAPMDAGLRARVKSYELAFRMQAAVPEAMRLAAEPPATAKLYGIDRPDSAPFGRLCLAARRLAERGVRFVQVFHGSNGGAGEWDAHGGLKANHARLCAQVDRPIAGLLRDLHQRGMLADTLVVWATEFGRTPGAQGGDGRDHHPYGFSVWMAGGGIKGGTVHGATDELGFHAVERRHYVTDIHATAMRLLGMDHRLMELPGRKRLEADFGAPIGEIIA